MKKIIDVSVKLSKIKMFKKIKLFFLIKINLMKLNMEKNNKFLKGPDCKTQTPIQWNFFGKPGKRTFFKIKIKSSKLALKKVKIKYFKIY